MKIDRPNSAAGTSSARRGERASSARPGEFARFLDTTSGPADVNAARPVSSMSTVLAAQMVDPDQERKQAMQRGQDILDRLDELRHALLLGNLSMGQILGVLNQIRTRKATVADPNLRELLDEIELRAEVEIAKFTANQR
jgi:hypothetical protein